MLIHSATITKYCTVIDLMNVLTKEYVTDVSTVIEIIDLTYRIWIERKCRFRNIYYCMTDDVDVDDDEHSLVY